MLTRIAPVAAAAAIALTLAGCTASPPSAEPSGSSSAGGSSSSGSDIYTPQGTTLALGDTATVDYQPDDTRRTALAITVSKVTLAPMSDFVLFELSAGDRKANYYYVEMTLDNVGDGTVGGDVVPVWGVSPKDVLLPPVSFSAKFKPCKSQPLPETLAPGDSVSLCEVYQVKKGGDLQALSYRPDKSFDPIVWSPITLSKG